MAKKLDRSATCPLPCQKTGQVLVRTPGDKKPRISAAGRGYVRRSEITPQMRVLVAIEPVDFRRGIDGLSQLCRAVLSADPLDGTMFVFRSQSAKSIKLLVYDGQGFWLAQKRMSAGKFRYWPTAQEAQSSTSRLLLTHEFHALIWGGNPSLAQAAPMWRRLPIDLAGQHPS